MMLPASYRYQLYRACQSAKTGIRGKVFHDNEVRLIVSGTGRLKVVLFGNQKLPQMFAAWRADCELRAQVGSVRSTWEVYNEATITFSVR